MSTGPGSAAPLLRRSSSGTSTPAAAPPRKGCAPELRASYQPTSAPALHRLHLRVRPMPTEQLSPKTRARSCRRRSTRGPRFLPGWKLTGSPAWDASASSPLAHSGSRATCSELLVPVAWRFTSTSACSMAAQRGPAVWQRLSVSLSLRLSVSPSLRLSVSLSQSAVQGYCKRRRRCHDQLGNEAGGPISRIDGRRASRVHAIRCRPGMSQ